MDARGTPAALIYRQYGICIHCPAILVGSHRRPAKLRRSALINCVLQPAASTLVCNSFQLNKEGKGLRYMHNLCGAAIGLFYFVAETGNLIS